MRNAKIRRFINIKVFILTEGSKHIGFGHITRCTSLYQAFQERDILPIFLINGDETVEYLLRDKNYEIFDWLRDNEKLFGFIKNADIVIIDSYLADFEVYEKISKSVKVPVYIDDNKRIVYPKGFVVNGTIYAEEIDYPKKEEITYLLGSQYIPIRKEFWDNVPDKAIRENIETIMLTFGGDDARDMTPNILKLLNENFPNLTKKVIIGKGFGNIKHIESLKNSITELIYYPDAEDMKRVMLESDVSISAAGQTLYELARVGVPTIAVAVADNQTNNVRGWQRAGFIEYAGAWEYNHLSDMLISSIRILNNPDLRRDRSFKGREHVDGLGAKRVVEFSISKFA